MPAIVETVELSTSWKPIEVKPEHTVVHVQSRDHMMFDFVDILPEKGTPEPRLKGMVGVTLHPKGGRFFLRASSTTCHVKITSQN